MNRDELHKELNIYLDILEILIEQPETASRAKELTALRDKASFAVNSFFYKQTLKMSAEELNF